VSTSWDISTSGLAATIFDFPLPVRTGNISSGPIGFRDSDNIGVAVEIALLASLQAEINIFPA
jgi:hypothetical protein